jgi:hypothetical protein
MTDDMSGLGENPLSASHGTSDIRFSPSREVVAAASSLAYLAAAAPPASAPSTLCCRFGRAFTNVFSLPNQEQPARTDRAGRCGGFKRPI